MQQKSCQIYYCHFNIDHWDLQRLEWPFLLIRLNYVFIYLSNWIVLYEHKPHFCPPQLSLHLMICKVKSYTWEVFPDLPHRRYWHLAIPTMVMWTTKGKFYRVSNVTSCWNMQLSKMCMHLFYLVHYISLYN